MKRFNFDLLETLMAVAESANFNEAASKLGISQPAVSFKIKELESQAPLPLFHLEGRRKVLTHYGRALYETSKQGVRSIDQSIEDLNRRYASPALLTLRVGGRTEVLEFVAPLLRFEGKIEMVGMDSTLAVKKLLAHEIDVAVSYLQPDSAEIAAKKLFHSSTYFVAHEKILNKKKLTLSLVKDREFLLSRPCIVYRSDGHTLVEWLAHTGISFSDLKVSYVAEDWRTVQSFVDRGLGYAIVPVYVKSSSDQVERLELPSQMTKQFTFYALYEKSLKKIDAFKKFLEFAG